MPSLKVHCAISRIRTKKDHKKLHQWIDEGHQERGVNHRSERHVYTDSSKNHVSKTYGGAEAVSEWLFHIALDNLDTSVINDWNYTSKRKKINFYRFGFCPTKYIYFDEEELTQSEIEDEFEDAYES